MPDAGDVEGVRAAVLPARASPTHRDLVERTRGDVTAAVGLLRLRRALEAHGGT